MAARKAGQPQSVAPFIALGTVAAVAAGIWYGYPGPAALLIGLLVWAWSEPGPQLTGPKKIGTTQATPASPAEEKKLLQYQTASAAQWAPLTSAWLPGWPVQASFVLALALAVLSATLPVSEPWMVAASAFGAFTGLAGFTAARRNATGNPGTTAKTLKDLAGARRSLVILIAAGLAGGALGAVAGLLLVRFLPLSPAGPAPFAPLLVAAAALTGLLGGVGIPWRAEAQKDWRELLGVREEWKPRWLMLKMDPAPVAVETGMVGPFRVTTFVCGGVRGTTDLFALVGKLDSMLGSSTAYSIVPSPAETKAGPQPGTVSPVKARIITWDADAWPDLTQPDTPAELADLACQTALAKGSSAQGMTPMVALDVSRCSTEESPTVMWRAELTIDQTTAGSFRISPKASGLTAGMLGWAALDHRQQGVQLYFGDPEAETPPGLAGNLEAIAEEDSWTTAWLGSLKTNVNPPTLQHQQSRTATLAGGQQVSQAAFVVRRGVDVTTMMTAETERRLVTALQGTTFLTITGWPVAGGRPGERHAQAYAVYYSSDGRLPASPEKLAPKPGSSAPQWMLSGFFNRGFDALKIPRPEVVNVKALTSNESRSGHIWEVRLRLYGGVTFGDVRTQAERLRQALGVTWLRVADADDGCIVFCGAQWRRAALTNPRRDTERLTRLDWIQAMTDAKVLGVGNRVPELVSANPLPNNDKVQHLEFDLPPGVDKEMLSKARQKLMTSTGLEYLELRKSSKGASSITILASEKDPMPQRAGFEVDTVAASPAVPFCVGVEGQPLDFDPVIAIHLLVLGGAGSGKSATLQTIITGALLKGWELYVTDPVKGGADFRFAEPWARAFTTELFDAAAMMRAVYSEVLRRKNLNSSYGVGLFRDLPEDQQPPYLLLVMDEFTSLMGMEMVDRTPQDDPEIEADRQIALSRNAARREIGMLAGKIAREARSAGVVLLLATQKLMSDDLDKIGSKDIKDNMARLLLGKTTYGAKMSGLISPDEAADLGEVVPKGRGLYETPMMYGSPVQIWYAPSSELAANVLAVRPPLDDSERVDLSPFDRRPKTNDGPAIRAVSIDDVAPLVEVVDLGEMEVDLTDLDDLAGLIEEAEPEPTSEPEPVAAPAEEPTAPAVSEPVAPEAEVFAGFDDIDWNEPEPEPVFDDLDWGGDAPEPVAGMATLPLPASDFGDEVDDPWRGVSGWEDA